MYDVFEVLASGMSSMRLRVNTIAANIANAQTTRTEDGGPYKKKDVVLQALDQESSFENALDEMSLSKPRVLAVVEDQSEPKKVYQPGHPDADESGYVAYPNVNVVESMTNLMMATRNYEANVSALKATRDMLRQASDIAGRF
ncbi:MAG: flagellar basal body rod protein FlgC [Bdellovibrionales bacterium]|nr:flagellar basal body rod protein FlgC [Bdellovibrionales bacterium]